MKGYKEPNINEEFVKRLEALDRLNKSKSMQGLAIELCKKDPVFFCNNFVFTFDPRRKPSMMPMILYPFQEEYIRWRTERINNKESFAVLKSRDMGLTWLTVYHQIYYWLFTENYKGTVASRLLDLVDKRGSTDSILEKARIILRYLPIWMLPKGYDEDKHATLGKFVNTSNGSSITDIGGQNAGRGGRSTVLDFDEWAFVEQADKVDSAISANSDVIGYISTPCGVGNNFYRKVTSGKLPVYTAHWKKDPRKNYWYVLDKYGKKIKEGNGDSKEDQPIYPWYEKQKATLEEVILKQEVEMDFHASMENIYIESKWVQACIDFDLPATGKIIAGFDVASSGTNSSVLTIRQGSKVIHIEAWKGLDSVQSAYKLLELWQDLPSELRWEVISIDADGLGDGTCGTFATIEDLPFTVNPFRGGSTPSELYWEGEEKTSKEKFANGRAENYGILRWRIKNTYDHRNGVRECSPDEMISIPNNNFLIMQLSQPLRKYTAGMKILIESKIQMKLRGLNSPDYSDALSYAFAPLDDVDIDWLLNC